MEKCIFCGWYRRTNDPTLKFFGIPREPGLKKVKWLYAIGDREISSRDKVCSIHFRQGRPSNDPSHEDFAPHLFLRRTLTQPVAKTLTYLESIANDEDLDVVPSVSESDESMASEPSRPCKPSILRKRRKTAGGGGCSDESQKTEQKGNENGQESAAHEKNASQEMTDREGEQQKSSPKDDTSSNVVTMTNPATGIKKRVKLQHLPRSFVEAVGIKPGQTVIVKRRIRVAKSTRSQAEGSDAMGNVLEKEESLLENVGNPG